MTEKIEEALNRLAAGTGKGSSLTSGTPDPERRTHTSGASAAPSEPELPDSADVESSDPGSAGPAKRSVPGSDAIGDPNCPRCEGIGYLRIDAPVGHPEFGRLVICSCRQEEVRNEMQERLFALSSLDELSQLTFERFKPQGRVGIGDQAQKSIQGAYQRAQHYAANPQGWLLLLGGFGSGKTHLAAAIANRAVAQGVPTLFHTAPDLLDSLRAAFSAEDTSFEQRFEEVRQAPLLILDDLGTQNATEWAREKLFQILNHRYVNRLPTVLTTNLALEEIEARIRSRISDPELVDRIYIQAPDYRRPLVDSGQPVLSTLEHHSLQTFGNFDLRKGEKLPLEQVRSLEEAFKAAQSFAEEPAGWILLGGGYGVGKTHLAAAIANYRAAQGFPALFVVIPDLLDHLRATFNPKSTVTYDRRFEEIRNAPLLVLDDLGTQATSAWAREKLYQLFNHRYVTELPTVITSSDRPDEIDPRLRSRLDDRRLCVRKLISVPSYRGGPPRRTR